MSARDFGSRKMFKAGDAVDVRCSRGHIRRGKVVSKLGFARASVVGDPWHYTVELEDGRSVFASSANMRKVEPEHGKDGNVCLSCGEPEDGGQFGWFDAEDGLRCNKCGADPTRPARRKRQQLSARQMKTMQQTIEWSIEHGHSKSACEAYQDALWACEYMPKKVTAEQRAELERYAQAKLDAGSVCPRCGKTLDESGNEHTRPASIAICGGRP